MNALLFPLDVRLSTWVVLALFLTFGLRDRRYWLAAAAWIIGFETTYQLTNTTRDLLRRGFHPTAWWVPVVIFGAFALGCAFVYFAARRGARPSLPLLGLAAFVWGVWIATGFHVNQHTMVHFDPAAEALNEGAKTLWALAYLLPLLLIRRARPPVRAGAQRATGAHP